MNDEEKQAFLQKAKKLFIESFATNHLNNTKELTSLENFNYNPFLVPYLAQFAYGNKEPESIAKVLFYPRALGTSASTGFGNYIQALLTELKTIYPSATSGMDIVFTDALDGKTKYCQLKAGPQTINKDDVEPIVQKCQSARRLIVTNRGTAAPEDFIIGVCYGDENSLSANYKKIIERGQPVLVGQTFWYHLTGDANFYKDLINAVSEVAEEINASETIEVVIKELTESIKNN